MAPGVVYFKAVLRFPDSVGAGAELAASFLVTPAAGGGPPAAAACPCGKDLSSRPPAALSELSLGIYN